MKKIRSNSEWAIQLRSLLAPSPCSARRPRSASRPSAAASRRRGAARGRSGPPNCNFAGFLQFFANFGGLVLGCIKTNFCKKIFVWQHFSSSTRFAYFCTAAISKFPQKIGLKNQQLILWKFSNNFENVAKSAKFAKFQKFSLKIW